MSPLIVLYISQPHLLSFLSIYLLLLLFLFLFLKMVSVLQNFSPTSFQERNNDGKTPYDLATERGHHGIAEQIAQFSKFYI